MLTALTEEEEGQDANDVGDDSIQEELDRTTFSSTIDVESSHQLWSNGPQPTNPVSGRSEPVDAAPKPLILLRGVVFGRSVRMSFCSIHVARLLIDDPLEDTFLDALISQETQNVDYNGCLCNDDDDDDVALIRMQFMGDNSIALRSYCRRFVKNGDLIEVSVSDGTQQTDWNSTPRMPQTAYWQSPSQEIHENNRPTSVWQAPRLVVNVDSIEHAVATVRVVQRSYWSMRRYQLWQRRYLPCTAAVVVNKKKDAPLNEPKTTLTPHGSGLNKRIQGDYVASFLFHMIAQKILCGVINTASVPLSSDPSEWALLGVKSEGFRSCSSEVISFLNRGSGVFDVAGGSGHVSMALGMLGVHSTVIDPRENAGKLPKRDRKIWQKSLTTVPLLNPTITPSSENNETTQTIYCLPIAVPFDTIRSFFGKPPNGIDTSYRHPDQKSMSFLDDERIRNCSAIVALHPDEATDAIVDTAIRLRIPFLIVPCCVFNRLFPNRRMPGRPKDVVSTHNDLIEYLQGKDLSIQKASLPFEGSNTVLWSIF